MPTIQPSSYLLILALGWVCGQLVTEFENVTMSGAPGLHLFCPIHCACLQRVSSISSLLLHTVDCTAGGLDDMPTNLSRNTQALILTSNHFHAEDIYNLDIFVNLTELDLSSNSMYSVENLQLDADSLLYLLLDHNKIDYLPNKSFWSAENLIFLSLVGNKIEIMHAQAFEGLSHLQTLDLSGNRIFDLDLQWFRNLAALRVLHLHDNNIHAVQPDAFKFVHSLSTLDLSENHIKHCYPGAFNGVESLHQLFLHDNNLNTVPNRAFRNFKSLNVVDLSANRFERLEEGAFQAINVSTVLLTRMPDLLLLDKGAISNMPHLQMLDLSNNHHFMYIDSHSLVNVPRLHTLKLNNNNLSTLEEILLEALPALSTLSFHSNAPHCDCNIKWLIEEILFHTHNLTILVPEEKPSAELTCASPPSLTGITMTTDQLHVIPSNCPPRILPLFSHEYNTALGETVRFDCRATGIPRPQTDWLLPSHHPSDRTEDIVVLKTGTRSDDNSHVTVSATGTLFVDYVQGTDQGQYTCLASNQQGRDERTAHVHVKNMEANVIIMRITSDAITVTWKSTRYAHDYQILYRLYGVNSTYHVIDIKPYMRSYTVSELEAETRYEFCIAVQHDTRSVRINCTQVSTRESNYLDMGVFNSRNYIIGGSIASFIVIFILICSLTHIVRKFNKRRRQQEELYSDNLSQLFLASMDSMSDTTPITYENRAAEMFDDDDIEEIRSTASMGSTTSSIR